MVFCFLSAFLRLLDVRRSLSTRCEGCVTPGAASCPHACAVSAGNCGRNKEKERLEVLRKYTKGYPSLAFSEGKKIKVETVIKLGDIKSGKKKSLRGRTRATVALKMFFPNREDKKLYKRLERIRKFKSASNKVKQSLGAMAAFQLGSPKNSPPNSPPNSPETLLIPTSKNAGSKKTFPHPKPPAGSSNVLKIRSANVMNRLSNTKSS